MNILKYILFCVRAAIGLFFVIVSGEKLIGPYQNFLYVVQHYDFFPPLLEEIVARTVPWVEFFLGVFLLGGLWLKKVLRLFLILILGFIAIIGQALIRGLPIEECGCFGGLFTLPPQATLVFDATLFILIFVMLIKIEQASFLSLDNYFENSQSDS